MTRWMVTIALVAVVGLARQSSAQTFQTFFAFLGPSPLTTACDNETPIPEGTTIKIFWDSDSNGPDLEDPQPETCDLPDCIGPFGALNVDEFPLEGLDAPGVFVSIDVYSVGGMANPPRYYLRIYDTDNTTILWTSAVVTMIPGYNPTYYTEDQWTCGGLGPQCAVIDETE